MDYQGNIWTQTDGTAIGKSISGDITGIYMEFYENEYILNPQKNAFIPAFWVRQVDDVYCLWQYGHETMLTLIVLNPEFNGQWRLNRKVIYHSWI